MNRDPFENGEYYHIYNRGTDKRNIFDASYDVERFLKSMEFFNSVDPIVSLYHLEFEEIQVEKRDKLVEIIAYCLNPNHYHLILKQLVDNGIPEFMKRLNGGYTSYFNFKNDRAGSLFQGTYKSKHARTNDYLLRLSAYVNLNDKVHQLRGLTPQLIRSSFEEYTTGIKMLCNTDVILSQFPTRGAYKTFALEALEQMQQRKKEDKELAKMLIE